MIPPGGSCRLHGDQGRDEHLDQIDGSRLRPAGGGGPAMRGLERELKVWLGAPSAVKRRFSLCVYVPFFLFWRPILVPKVYLSIALRCPPLLVRHGL